MLRGKCHGGRIISQTLCDQSGERACKRRECSLGFALVRSMDVQKSPNGLGQGVDVSVVTELLQMQSWKQKLPDW